MIVVELGAEELRMRSPLHSWTGLSKLQRTELYFRWSLYTLPLVLLPVTLIAAGARADLPDFIGVVRIALLVALVSTLLGLRACRTSLDRYLKRPGDHLRWLAANSAFAMAGAWTVLLSGPSADGAAGHGGAFTSIVAVTLLCIAFGPVSIGLSLPLASLAAAGGLLLLAPPMLLAGYGVAGTAGTLVGTLVMLPLLGGTCRSFAWLTSMVWELDAAREAQSRLAVAEERLRFSRDLHDVMGRNLTTIALKSELAVQLARRGRPEAADQMTEVQKIAQESQREVRDVIRGYRTADLHAEAIGARAVLRSADIACEIDLGEDADALPAPVQSVLGWVIRESTTNVLRHSEAGRCLIRLRTGDGRAVLELENDGVPAVPLPSQGSGTGLRGLRERLAALDGELTVPTAEAGVFRMLATVPLPS